MGAAKSKESIRRVQPTLKAQWFLAISKCLEDTKIASYLDYELGEPFVYVSIWTWRRCLWWVLTVLNSLELFKHKRLDCLICTERDFAAVTQGQFRYRPVRRG